MQLMDFHPGRQTQHAGAENDHWTSQAEPGRKSWKSNELKPDQKSDPCSPTLAAPDISSNYVAGALRVDAANSDTDAPECGR